MALEKCAIKATAKGQLLTGHAGSIRQKSAQRTYGKAWQPGLGYPDSLGEIKECQPAIYILSIKRSEEQKKINEDNLQYDMPMDEYNS